MRREYRVVLTLAVLLCSLSISCQRVPEHRYDLKGKVISVDRDRREATLAHEEIKGFMEAMTMPFTVKDDWALKVLEPGQTVEATLVIRGDDSWIEGLHISKTESIPPISGATPALKAGDEVPDFTLLNQDDKRIHLSQYRGHFLLLTFIYTRCPLPNFCPLTSKNFSEIHRVLQSLPASAKKLHLLTVSFDAEFDTPAVLRDYARRYINPVSYKDWEFATGSPEETKTITTYFGLAYRRESGQIVHSLVTALIGPDGRLVHLYTGNKWTPKQILSALR